MWTPIRGGITAPGGFQAAGIRAGLKLSNKPDLAILLAPENSICAGAFTQSLVRASCIDLARNRLKALSGRVRAVLVNSGQANACIGHQGMTDSLLITEALASSLGLLADEVLICSTGVIGVPIPVNKILKAIEPLVQGLSADGGHAAAQAILTTDLVDKQIALEADLGGRRVRIGGMAKGSGMIHPNMATMLGYLTCDAGVAADLWQEIIQRVVNHSFNAISVDGDTSTNDAFLAFNSGEPLAEEHFVQLELGLTTAAKYLAKAITRDGEGATCLFEVQVEGTSSEKDSLLIARTIASSSLVKTAVHGCDPNWGRIIAAAGRAGVQFQPDKISLWIDSYKLMQNGQPLDFDYDVVSNFMKEAVNSNHCIQIRLVVGNDIGVGFAWGCDLSDQYVRINADYTT